MEMERGYTMAIGGIGSCINTILFSTALHEHPYFFVIVKLPAHRRGFPRTRSGEPDASKGNFVRIVPLDPAYLASAGRGTFRPCLRVILY